MRVLVPPLVHLSEVSDNDTSGLSSGCYGVMLALAWQAAQSFGDCVPGLFRPAVSGCDHFWCGGVPGEVQRPWGEKTGPFWESGGARGHDHRGASSN